MGSILRAKVWRFVCSCPRLFISSPVLVSAADAVATRPALASRRPKLLQRCQGICQFLRLSFFFSVCLGRTRIPRFRNLCVDAPSISTLYQLIFCSVHFHHINAGATDSASSGPRRSRGRCRFESLVGRKRKISFRFGLSKIQHPSERNKNAQTTKPSQSIIYSFVIFPGQQIAMAERRLGAFASKAGEKKDCPLGAGSMRSAKKGVVLIALAPKVLISTKLPIGPNKRALKTILKPIPNATPLIFQF